MRTRVLGIIVLLYCAFHWLPLAPILLFTAITADAWGAFDAVLSLILFIGGFAILCERSWGRGLIRFSSAGLILGNLVNLGVSVLNSPTSTLFSSELVGNLPLLIIFLGSFVAKSPSEIDEKLSRKKESKKILRDVAYGSYLWVGVSMTIFCIARLYSSDAHWRDLAILAVAFPILWPSPLIALVGVISSIAVIRDWRLIVLALLTISSMLLFFGAAYEFVDDAEFFTFIFLASILIFMFSVRWFASARRRQ